MISYRELLQDFGPNTDSHEPTFELTDSSHRTIHPPEPRTTPVKNILK